MKFALKQIIQCDPIENDSTCNKQIRELSDDIPQSDRLECWTEMDQQMCTFDKIPGETTHIIQHFLSKTNPKAKCKSCTKRQLDKCLRENCSELHEQIIQACKSDVEGGFGDRGCKASQRVLSCPAFSTEGGRMRCRNYQKCVSLNCYQDTRWPLPCLETHCRRQLQDFQLSCATKLDNPCSLVSSTLLCSHLHDESDRNFCLSLFTCGSKHCSLPDPNCVSESCPATALLHHDMCSHSEECKDTPFSPLSYGPEATHRCTDPDSPRHLHCLNAEKCTSHCPFTPKHRDPLANMDASWASFLIWLGLVGASLALITSLVIIILKRTEYWNKLKDRWENRLQKRPSKLESIQESKEKEKLYLPDAKLDFGDIFDNLRTPVRIPVSDISLSEMSEEVST